MGIFSLAPIQEDIRRQIKVTHQLLDAIDTLHAIAETVADAQQKAQLERIITQLSEATDTLTENAGKTSTFVRSIAS